MQGGLSLKKSFRRRALELLFHIIAILSLSYYTIYTFVISAGVDEAFATFSVLIYWSIYLLIAGFLAPKKKKNILFIMSPIFLFIGIISTFNVSPNYYEKLHNIKDKTIKEEKSVSGSIKNTPDSATDKVTGPYKFIDIKSMNTLEIQNIKTNEVKEISLLGLDTNLSTCESKKIESQIKKLLKDKNILLELDNTTSNLNSYYIWSEDQTINYNNFLIRNGYAKAQKDLDYGVNDHFLEAESTAKSPRLGIWASAYCNN